MTIFLIGAAAIDTLYREVAPEKTGAAAIEQRRRGEDMP